MMIPKMKSQIEALLHRNNADEFNEFRAENSEITIDLSGVDVSGVNFLNFNLSGLDLSGVHNLGYANNLGHADLAGVKVSNEQMVSLLLLERGDSFNALRVAGACPDFSLEGVNFSKLNVEHRDFTGLDLRGVEHLEKARNLDSCILDRSIIAPEQFAVLPESVKQFNDYHEISVLPKDEVRSEVFNKALESGGKTSFNALRAQHPDATIDLAGLDASKVKESDLNLQGMDLTGVKNIERMYALWDADLKGATLSNKQLVALLENGIWGAFHTYCEANPDAEIDLKAGGVSVANVNKHLGSQDEEAVKSKVKPLNADALVGKASDFLVGATPVQQVDRQSLETEGRLGADQGKAL